MASAVISSSSFVCKSPAKVSIIIFHFSVSNLQFSYMVVNLGHKDLGFSSFRKPSQISIHGSQKKSISRKIVSVMAPQRSSSTSGSVKTGMTMTEKILAKAAEKSHVVPGDNIWVNVDVLMTHDVCGPGAFGIFKREFGENAKQKDLGFPKSSQISVHRCQKRAISRKIVSVMAPQRSSSATGSVKTGMTMTEKILAKAAEKSQVVPGDNIWVNVDVLMTHDVCGPGAFGIFKREFGEKAKVWDPEKIVVIPDHYIFTTDKRANRNVDIMREHCREQNIKYFYDITDLGDFRANPDYKGVCHVALAQEGHCRPGEVLLGTDSHTCTAGAFGQFATGIGNTDAGFVLGTGKILLKVPPTMRFILDGEMPSYLQAKDLILQVSVLSLLQHLSPFTASELLTGPFGHKSEIIGEISVAGATYKTMEFSGTTIESLTMEERMTLCNMVVEAGGKNGVIPPDATTFNYVEVWDSEKIVVIPDHYIFTTDKRANRNVDIMREHCREQNIKYFYDITDLGDFRANPDYKGVCHVALAQEGHCRPGEVLLGTDSHTCTAGAFGQFATGIGNTDAGFVLGTGKILLKVPPTMRFILDGEMPSYLQAKDLILQASVICLTDFVFLTIISYRSIITVIIGEISVAGATYKTMEFSGTTIESLTMEERMTLCNMVVEAGGKNGVIPPDATTFNYVENRTSVPFQPVYSDGNARYNDNPMVPLCKYGFLIALSRECKDVKIDRVYIGSCTGGKTEDFMAAAKLFHAAGKQVKVPTFLVPATQKVWMDVYALPVPGAGGKTCAQIFEEAGCDTPTSPSCGACLGGPADTYARLNEPQVCVSTTNRNFPGRMGHKEGQIYLASPYTAAASALTGHVTDPREFLQ
ncbi:hypothetical protein F2Q68_00026629 [Brassica cretica]|uniref:Aconitase/3-isopropylmalate dehydratase large subunit alpha/beta/alpha domain-containing protein n=1 Tax=Brassica cretica TaxID=69181 RepID=A0A8S9IGB7_BRACR|nr:hypothetical protein F2Q68_00026629 [Brassica cretica]